MDITELKDKFFTIKPYIINIKAIVGIAAIIFAINTAVTDIPKKWQTYTEAVNNNTKLVEEKSNLSEKEATLKAISKELDNMIVKITQVQPAQSPELAAIAIAQKVLEIGETSQNIAGSLQPRESVSLNVDAAVQLPISASSDSSVPASDQNTTEASSSPSPPDAQTAEGAQNTINAFKYGLSVSGNYVSLAKFIHELAMMNDFIMINRLKIRPSSQGPYESQANQSEVVLEIDFMVPWQK